MLKLLGHIILSGFIILSMTGLTVNLHYCEEGLYDIALNAPADNCCEEGAHDHNCHLPADNDKSDHCDDETIKVETTDFFVLLSFPIEFSDHPVIDLCNGTTQFTENQGTGEITAGKLLYYKKPPLPSEVVLSQIQSFLI